MLPGHVPAVDPQRRGEEGQALHVIGVLGGEKQAEQRARRQAADDHRVAGLAQLGECGLRAPVPVLPGGGLHFLGGAAMPRELRAEDGVALTRQTVRDVAHLAGRATQTVDQEHPDVIAGHAVGLVLRSRGHRNNAGARGADRLGHGRQPNRDPVVMRLSRRSCLRRSLRNSCREPATKRQGPPCPPGHRQIG